MTGDREQLVDTIRTSIAEKKSEKEILTTAAKLIDCFSEGFDWTGFYMMRGGILEVGPYVGPETPHKKIELSDGLCGAAAREKQSIVVDDVNADDRFLACSITTRSEIVVPLMNGDEVIGEIDIDSNEPGHFNEDDRKMLEAIAHVIVERLKEVRGG